MERARDGAVAAVAAGVVGGLAAADGGYFPQSWGWATLALLWAAAAALLLGRPRIGVRAVAALALLTAFVAWTLLSALWSESVPLTVLEAERGLLYVCALAAFLLVGRQRAALAGALIGIVLVCVANVVLRVPGVAGGEAEPVGYANGLALLAALGVVIACGFAPWGLLALPLLGVVLVLMNSRGAWLALAVAAAVAVAPRFRLATVAGGIAVGLAAGFATSGYRPEYWSVALGQWLGAPVGGTGAGTFPRVWLRERDVTQTARDAHSLYLETLGELGVVGVLLLLAFVVLPLLRSDPARAAASAYAAFVVHAALDWDWEQAAPSVVALVAASSLLAGREREAPRVPALAATGAAALVAAVTLLGNVAVARSAAAASAADWPASERWARVATRVAPWAAEPWLRLGEAERATGSVRAARRSFREATERDASDVEAWRALARVAAGAERARAHQRAVRLDPRGTPPVEP